MQNRNGNKIMKIKFGKRMLDFPGKEMGLLKDSNELIGKTEKLKTRLSEDGYLLLRGFIDREKVMAARQQILEHLEKMNKLVPGKPLLEGVMPQGISGVDLAGYDNISHHPVILDVLENPKLFELFGELFGENVDTYNYKWLRAIGNKEFTGAHYDIVYMGRGSKKLHTVWVPFGDITPDMGTLAICPGSNQNLGHAKLKNTYGKIDVDRDRIEGWFTRDPLEITEKYGGQWQTAEFKAGDIILFGMYTMHASTTNLTTSYRISCDIRFQPSNEPHDDRWEGKKPKGHTDFNSQPLKSMAEARAEWGV
jgi:ectoine hydroxylase-related dioxygenase (phytanoyl-CoA dioxygenase family)